MITLKEIKRQLPGFDTYSIKDGICTVRREFFYTHGKSAKDAEDHVKKAFPQVTIVESGEVWKPFKGGATVANQSHWFVKFTAPKFSDNSMMKEIFGTQLD